MPVKLRCLHNVVKTIKMRGRRGTMTKGGDTAATPMRLVPGRPSPAGGCARRGSGLSRRRRGQHVELPFRIVLPTEHDHHRGTPPGLGLAGRNDITESRRWAARDHDSPLQVLKLA